MEVVQVQPRDSYLHYIYVGAKDTTICWSFTTKRKSIAFGLYRRLGSARLPSSSEFIFQAQQEQQQRRISVATETFPQQQVVTSTGEQQQQHKRSNSLSEYHKSGLHHLLHSKRISNGTPSRANKGAKSSMASIKLKEQEDLIEVIPIQHCTSANIKVEGNYTVNIPGNYILVFDNTFSRNTPKILSFSVALIDPNTSNPRLSIDDEPPNYIVSGWLLKKKRKKLQVIGWARRWFQLSASGVLSYSTSPASVTRGSIQILVATISINPLQRLIHIDSGTMLYHLKTLNAEDQAKWTNALREFRMLPSNLPCNNEEHLQHPTDPCMLPPTPTFENGDHVLQHYFKEGSETTTQLMADMEAYMHRIDQLVTQLGLSTAHLAPERKKIMDTMGYQKDLWHKAKLLYDEEQTAAPPSSSAMPKQSETHLTLPRRELSPFIHSNASWRGSAISDQYFDAEEILLSDEEDESPIVDDTDDDEDYDDDDHRLSPPLGIKHPTCQRRQILPSPVASAEISALSVIRKNVGKDLSTISMPISMNEPLSLLQRACEELEYSELLDKASGMSNSMDRLLHVAVFAVSGYASSQHRVGRKPFNPMMNETYENIRPDKGFRFIAEKVSHNPVIIAAHAESSNYKYWQCVKVRSKFWGKSMELINEGTFHVTLTGHDDHITYSKPSSWLRNMIAGNKYLEHVGEMKVVNHTTGEHVLVTFREHTTSGYYLFGSSSRPSNEVIMTAYNAQGHKCRRVVGKWNDMLAEEVNMNPQHLSVLWTATPPTVNDPSKYYGFTQFAIELNEITTIERDKLPKTDSRLRPDLRLYEKGHVEEADQEKVVIEQKQRERRRELEMAGVEWKPRWFKLQHDPYAESHLLPCQDENMTQTWQFMGEYWKARESGQWPNDQFDIW
ncbi:hypothetical protein K492DRAFT_233447 [Lichtheimia hyalospora FSU 10163]|nr:hypothetical protein K492DRAFT_233447 [Lichtheimia hyalospora FSU 10163]